MNKINVIKERCPQNHACPLIRLCPVGAISQEGFAAPEVDQEKCLACGRCVKFCGYQAFTMN